MIPLNNHWCSLIDITNVCHRNCSYCTRYDRHLGNKCYNMSLEDIENSLKSYLEFSGLIGYIGGDPLLHPQFKQACEIARKYYPKEKMHLFTSIDPNKSKYKDDIYNTFLHIAYHPHNPGQEKEHYHQPLTIAIKDAVKNEQLKTDLINDCWCNRKWLHTITDDGAFFCEVGAGIAKLLGVKGWNVDNNWWKKEPQDFGYQLDLCQYCGMCIPMQRQHMSEKKQKISPSFLKILQDNNLPAGDYELFDREITVKEMKEALPMWSPGLYKNEQMGESFNWSTLDWSKYED